jgi:GH18 family chitinase
MDRLLAVSQISSFKNDLDGIDFDWEYPSVPDMNWLPPSSPDEAPNYLKFICLMRSKLPNNQSPSPLQLRNGT